ncbi:MAG: GNAT family N-acetyltransferase, partial [Acidimicrobiales bacterium]|nr:GNAT family N-acetyltransferase [Acidimicrobiales bacterium]
ADVAAAVNASLQHLQPWMAWAAEPATEAGMAVFFATAEELWDQRRDFGFHVVEGPADEVVGGGGLHGRIGRHGLEIGYWIHVDRIGQGIATDLGRSLTAAAFAIDGIERVRVQCEDTNVRSARVPKKLGYAFLGVGVPDSGPCAGRPTQAWEVDRDAWMAAAAAKRS